MRFNEIIGLEETASGLRGLVKQDRLPGALLLVGHPGGGQLALAIALAQYALCQNRGGRDSCGECPACRKMEKLVHPDAHFSFPYTKPKVTSNDFLPEWRQQVLENPYLEISDWLEVLQSENKQGKIYAEECASIIRKLNLKTFEADRRILIMWRPEYLGPLEGNRLLKLIEEPPDGTTIILVAEDTERILLTILSRCQILKVPAFSQSDIAGFLQEKNGKSETDARAIAQLSDGNLNTALKLSEESQQDLAEGFVDWFRSTFKGKSPELVSWADRISTWSRDKQRRFLEYGLHFLREVLFYKELGEAGLKLRPAEVTVVKDLDPHLDLDQLEQISELYSEAIGHVGRNAHAKILFLSLGLRVNRVQRKKTPLQVALDSYK